MLIVDDAAGQIGPIGYGVSVVGAVDQQVQGVLVVDAAIVDQIGRLAASIENWGATECIVGAVIDGEDLAGLGHHDVERIAQAGRKNAQRRVSRQDRLVKAVVAAKATADIEPSSGLVTRHPVLGNRQIIERRQIVFVGASDARAVCEDFIWYCVERNQVDLEHCTRKGIFRGVPEVGGWRAVVGIASGRVLAKRQ